MSQSKKLSSLLIHLPGDHSLSSDPVVSRITVDSRLVQPGDLFVANSDTHDGHRFISEAIKNGAAAILDTKPQDGLSVPYIRVEESRNALAQLSAAFFDFPSSKLTMIGVTGTDGKTTTANLIYHILHAAGLKAGMISTVNAIIGDETLDTGFHVTTPEAFDVQRYLAQMVANGLTHAILEATSHGLAAQRVRGDQFDIGVVTNIQHEHLDYHGSYEEYRAAKARLFTGLAHTPPKLHNPTRAAVLNRDDISYDYLAGAAEGNQISYGLDSQADLRAENIEYSPSGLRFMAVAKNLDLPIEANLVGEYNVSNCLAAAAAAVLGLGIEPKFAQEGVAALEGIPGRMEAIDMGQEFLAIVDFAHTPNALRRALETARQICAGRVIAVFGSAGLRDREKRRLMAEISAEDADLTVLTAEDPRTESLDDILAEMAAGAQSKGGVEKKDFWRVPDRGAAIRFALDLAQPGDLVMALGKGHEQSMCFVETEYPWDDRTAMRAALADYLGVEGPEMPYLPTQD